MPTLRHPRALDDVPGHPPRTVPSAAVGERVTVDDAGEFEVAEASDARDLADAYGVDLDRLVVDDGPETCDTVKSDGEVCGRELPCPYHSPDA
jgi:hypothetical protein